MLYLLLRRRKAHAQMLKKMWSSQSLLAQYWNGFTAPTLLITQDSLSQVGSYIHQAH